MYENVIMARPTKIYTVVYIKQIAYIWPTEYTYYSTKVHVEIMTLNISVIHWIYASSTRVRQVRILCISDYMYFIYDRWTRMQLDKLLIYFK